MNRPLGRGAGELVEAPGTAPGSDPPMSRGVYRHSRLPDAINIGDGCVDLKTRVSLPSPRKAGKGAPICFARRSAIVRRRRSDGRAEGAWRPCKMGGIFRGKLPNPAVTVRW